MSIDVNNESGVDIDVTPLVAVSRHVLDRLRVHRLAELSVVLVDTEAIEQLHVKWMDEPGPTDVLSFPIDATDEAIGPRELGDVVISPEDTEDLREAVVHGVLHLVGMDHEVDDGEMLALQREILTW